MSTEEVKRGDMLNIYHSDYTMEQIAAAIGKNPEPRLVDGVWYWFIWDVIAMEYVATAVKAEGVDGEVTAAQLAAAITSVNANLAPVEATSTASRSYAVGELLIFGGVLREVTAEIAVGDTIAPGTNVSAEGVTYSKKVTPENAGAVGQVLTKTATGAKWAEASGGLLPQVLVTTKAGASVTATLGSVTVGPVVADSQGEATLDLTDYGTWTLTATLDSKTDSGTLEVTDVMQYSVTLSFVPLPAGYTLLEFLQSDGNACIDTGFKLSEAALDGDIYLPDTERQYFFGAQTSSSGRYYRFLIGVNQYLPDGYFDVWKSNGTVFRGSTAPTGTKFHLTAKIFNSAVSVSIDGAAQALSQGDTPGASGIPSVNDSLFCVTSAGKSSARIYGSFSIYSDFAMANLIAKYYPVRRDSDGVVGMYDTVTGTFLTNAGTGNFIAGPEV